MTFLWLLLLSNALFLDALAVAYLLACVRTAPVAEQGGE